MALLTRRDMLKLSGTLAAGSLLAACTPAATTEPTEPPVDETEAAATDEPTEPPPPPPPEGTVVMMHKVHEVNEDQQAAFEADNPGIDVEVIPDDLTRFFAMYAAGDPPDLLRVQAPSVPQYLARDMLYDLTPYFEASSTLNLDDLASANNYYKANSPLDVGDGPIYGMCKDFSPDLTLFIYTTLFTDSDLAIPDDTTPLTYQEIYTLAEQLAAFEGDRTTVFGYEYANEWVDRFMMVMLDELGKNIFTSDYSQLAIAADEDALAVAQYYFDLAVNRLTVSPINPSPSWIGADFNQGIAPLLQYGFWFGAMAESEVTAGNVMMLPAPTWSGERRSPTVTATGMIMAAASDVPDAAWQVFEWYNAGQPSIDRASSGWGVPALMSQWDLMPNETEYEQQKLRVLQGELALETPPVQFSPFLGETTISNTWNIQLDRALQGEITFEEMIANVETEVNQAIQEGVNRIM